MNATRRLIHRRARLAEARASSVSAAWRLLPMNLEVQGTASATALPELSTGPALGCIVTRRVVDGAGRVWRVRVAAPAATSSMEGRSPDREVLMFQCESPGVPPEIRRTARPLTGLGNGDLLQLLEYDC